MTAAVRLETKVDVAFNDDTTKLVFLGYEVWVRRRVMDEDVDAAITRMVFNTFRGSAVSIKADAEEVLRDVLKAVHEHPDFPVWDVHNA